MSQKNVRRTKSVKVWKCKGKMYKIHISNSTLIEQYNSSTSLIGLLIDLINNKYLNIHLSIYKCRKKANTK